MSGFFGILRLDGQPVEERFLERIAAEMSFRGPDGTGIWNHAGIGSAFALMRTGPVEQAPRQPVSWDDRFLLWGDLRLDARDTILVKGPLTSLLAYGDPAIRSYVDLDLLLRHQDIRTATQHMLDLGFESDVPQSAIRAGKIPGEYLFCRPHTQRIVELHTEHTFRYYPKRMPIDNLFARKRNVFLDGREIPALSLEDEFVLNCIHGAKHFWERLMWIADIAALVAKHAELQWDKAQRAAAEVGAQRMLRVAVQLAASVLRVKVPVAFTTELEKDRGVVPLCRQIESWLPYAGAAPPRLPRRAMFRVDMAGGGLIGAAYLARLSLFPTQEDWAEGAEERRSWLRDAVRRPLRLFRKYGSNE